MKKSIFLAYLALILSFLLPYVALKGENLPLTAPEVEPEATEQLPEKDSPEPAAEQTLPAPESPEISLREEESGPPAPDKIRLLTEEGVKELDMQEYITGVLAAEMPADFGPEALKAQAVAARSFAIYCARSGKHEDADVCGDFSCCQAYIDEEKMRENWGESFSENYNKIASAAAETEGEYLVYEGEPVFAAFHSSSGGATEDCGEVWGEVPYLKSVETPESEKTVPNFISTLSCAPIDFRDCILSEFPSADFTGEESGWVGEAERDPSGRVRKILIGGTEIKGKELRKLFSLRSADFTLQYQDGKFLFTVRGFGHGVGMSQYGAKIMAHRGSDYKSILAHYYPGTSLIS